MTREKKKKTDKIILQPRDLEIVRLVQDYRFLDTELIFRLTLGHSPGISLKSKRPEQMIQRRLCKLHRNGYLHPIRLFRVLSPDSRSSRVYAERTVYGLGQTGAEVLAEAYGMDAAGDGGLRKKISGAGEPFIRHALMVSRIRAALTLAMKGGSRAEFLFWKQGDEIRDKFQSGSPDGGISSRTIGPDGLFGLRDGGGSCYYYVEADRGTMTRKRYLAKLRNYWAYWKAKKHTRRHGISDFRVLTVTTTRRRRDGLREVARQADDKKKGSAMFWFASEEDFDFREPESILGLIWRSAADGESYSVLD